MIIDISKLDKAAVLAALYNAGISLDRRRASDTMTIDEARKLLEENTLFYYLEGRIMNIDLRTDTLSTYSYDEHNGHDTAVNALSKLRTSMQDAWLAGG